MEFLKKNALKFLIKAEDSFKNGEFNFTMFFIEQFFQLSLKYIISRKYGDFPRTHSLKILFELTKDERLFKFYKENLDVLREIELSYIASRYFDVEYTRKIAENSLRVAEKFLEVAKIDRTD